MGNSGEEMLPDWFHNVSSFPSIQSIALKVTDGEIVDFDVIRCFLAFIRVHCNDKINKILESDQKKPGKSSGVVVDVKEKHVKTII